VYMSDKASTQGERIRLLFERVEDEVAIVAPFIKLDALRSLLNVIPVSSHVRCVTRWIPREVAQGISDVQVFDALIERGNATVSLVDNLHAKMYIAGTRCLVGSANLTLAGLGERGEHSNIEVLVETDTHDLGIVSTLDQIALAERIVTREIAESARLLAESISGTVTSKDRGELPWFPGSRTPDQAFRVYSIPQKGFVSMAERILRSDVALSDIQPGLDHIQFRDAIRELLYAIPIAQKFLDSGDDSFLTLSDAYPGLEGVIGDQFSAEDRWQALVRWMACFFPEKVMIQERTELTLRRARILS